MSIVYLYCLKNFFFWNVNLNCSFAALGRGELEPKLKLKLFIDRSQPDRATTTGLSNIVVLVTKKQKTLCSSNFIQDTGALWSECTLVTAKLFCKLSRILTSTIASFYIFTSFIFKLQTVLWILGSFWLLAFLQFSSSLGPDSSAIES